MAETKGIIRTEVQDLEQTKPASMVEQPMVIPLPEVVDFEDTGYTPPNTVFYKDAYVEGLEV